MEKICDNCKYSIEVICVDNNLIECMNDVSINYNYYWSKKYKCKLYEENKTKSRNLKINNLLNGR